MKILAGYFEKQKYMDQLPYVFFSLYNVAQDFCVSYCKMIPTYVTSSVVPRLKISANVHKLSRDQKKPHTMQSIWSSPDLHG